MNSNLLVAVCVERFVTSVQNHPSRRNIKALPTTRDESILKAWTTLFVISMFATFGTITTAAQSSSNLESVPLNQRPLMQYLMESPETFETRGVAGMYYSWGVYVVGIQQCPELNTAKIPADRLNMTYPISDVMETTQALAFQGQGRRDIESVVDVLGCDSPVTRAVIRSAEIVTVRRIEFADEVRAYRERSQRTEAQKKAEYERNAIAFGDLLNDVYREESQACSREFRVESRQWSECNVDARDRDRQARHEMVTSLEHSNAHREFETIVYGLGAGAADIDFCEYGSGAAVRVEAEVLSQRYYPDLSTSLLANYEAAYDKMYKARAAAKEMYGTACAEQHTGYSRALLEPEGIQKQIDDWYSRHHGGRFHQPHGVWDLIKARNQ